MFKNTHSDRGVARKSLRSIYVKGILLTVVLPLIAVSAFYNTIGYFKISVHDWLEYLVLLGPVVVGTFWWKLNLLDRRWLTIILYIFMMLPFTLVVSMSTSLFYL